MLGLAITDNTEYRMIPVLKSLSQTEDERSDVPEASCDVVRRMGSTEAFDATSCLPTMPCVESMLCFTSSEGS